MTRLLLDSHVLIWYTAPISKLKPEITDLIRDAEEVFISAATIWELTIKQVKGKFDQNPSLIEKAKDYGFLPLSITQRHGEAVGELPRHHRDPFDHLLLAQAKVEGLTLVTHDAILAHYGVPVLLV